jgi:hypothetical protein
MGIVSDIRILEDKIAQQPNYTDTSGKRGFKYDPGELNRLVRSIYKVLLTLGMKDDMSSLQIKLPSSTSKTD